jgi:hypothetical protein
MSALDRANDVRIRRATLKRDIKAGRMSASQILAVPRDWAETMRVFDLLMVVPKCGRVKAAKALQVAEVSPRKTLGGISERQRRDLLRWLHGR